MATLEDSLLAELDDLSDGEVEEDLDVDVTDLQTLNNDDDLDNVSKLQRTQRFIDIIQKVDEALRNEADGLVSEHDLEQNKVIVGCSQLFVDIENEIVIVHCFIRERYRVKFRELESLVPDAIVLWLFLTLIVKRIGNETDLTLIDLEGGLIRGASAMAVLLSASTMEGNLLPEDVLQKTMEACDRVLDLDEAKNKVFGFVESKMGSFPPNLSAVVGYDIAAKLVGTAGGLQELAKMPACNVQVLGRKRKNLAGFSTAMLQSRVGYLEQTEIHLDTPPGLRMRTGKLLAAKLVLAARVDSTRGDPLGAFGKALREEIYKKIDKWQEPNPGRQPKPLPVPYSDAKKKRGGRRHRKTKERYAMTRMRTLSNRVAFGTVPEESSLGDGLGEGYGMLGQAGSKRLRVYSVPSKLKPNKKLMERQYAGGARTTTNSGLTSSLAITDVQAMTLINPQASGLNSGAQSVYFSK